VNLTLHALLVSRIANSLANEFESRKLLSVDHDFGKRVGYTMCGLALTRDLLILARLADLGLLVFGVLLFIFWVVYWVKISGYSKILCLPHEAGTQTQGEPLKERSSSPRW
jgi:hypothetical protein